MKHSPGLAANPPRRSGDTLTWIGGADRAILQAAPTNRSSFSQMGLVVLATAGLGVLSMSFALHNGLHLPVPLAVMGGLIWGCIIAVIDRFLVMNLKLRGGLAKAFVVVGLRVAIAALLGIVISTPLVLQIFEKEISAQVVRDNLDKSVSDGKVAAETPESKQLNETKAKIVEDENTLRGILPAADSPEIKSQQEYLEKARQDAKTAQDAADTKYRAWQCELYGSSCEGSTSIPGNGNLARAREAEYKAAKQQADTANDAVTKAETAVTSTRESASTQGRDALKKAQDAANAELPGLRQRANELQAFVNGNVNNVSTMNSNDKGILAQIVALGHLNNSSSAAAMTHYSVSRPALHDRIASCPREGPDQYGAAIGLRAYPRRRRRRGRREREDRKAPGSARPRRDRAASRGRRQEGRRGRRRHARARAGPRRQGQQAGREGDGEDSRRRIGPVGTRCPEDTADRGRSGNERNRSQWDHAARDHAAATVPPAPQPTTGAPNTVRSKFNLPNGKKIGSTNGSTP